MKASARALAVRRPASEAARRNAAKRVAGDIGRSRGVPMAQSLRAGLEPAFGHDFGRIRIHSDEAAGQASAGLGAEAFATGAHLFFAPGRFRPETQEGRRLLAHELAHSVQQGQGAPFAGQLLRVTAPGDALEREADRAASEASTGRPIERGALQADQPAARGVIGRFAIFALAFEHLLESVDPALTVNRIATETLQVYESDPQDRAGRLRNQLDRLDPRTRRAVMDRIQTQATIDQWSGLTRLLEDSPSPGAQLADVPADNIIPLPVRRADGEPAAAGPEPKAPEKPAEPGAEVKEKLGAKPGMAPGAEEPGAAEAPGEAEAAKPGAPAVPTPEGVPVPEAPSSAAGAPAPEGGATAGAAPSGAPAAAGAGGADQADVSAAERAGLPTAADAERQPAPGAVVAPAPAPPRPVPAEPAPEPRAEPAEAGPALPASDHAAAAELESAAGTDESSGPGAAAAVATEPAPARATAPPAAAPSAAAELETAPPAAAPEPAEPTAVTAAAPAEAPAAEAPAPEAPLPAETPARDEAPAEGPALSAPGAAVEAPAGAPPMTAPTAVAVSEGPATSEAATPMDAESEIPESPTPEAGPAPTAAPAVAAPAEAPTPAVADAGGATSPEAGPSETMAAPPAQMPADPSAGPQPAALGPGVAAGQAPAAPPATGICAMVAPPAEGDAGGGQAGGACGGGAAAAGPEPAPPEPAPPAAGADPVEAVSQAQGQSPAQVQQAMCGATDAANHSVDQQQQELAASPPTLERPSGSPADKDGAPAAAPAPEPADSGRKEVERVPEGQPVAPPAPEPLPAPPPVPVEAVRPPAIPGESQIDEHAAAQVKDAVRSIPVTDPALNVTAGEAPQVQLTGDADPAQGKQQRQKLDESASQATDQGKQDAAQPMGEKDVYPQVPKETLRSDPGAAPSDPSIPACTIGAGGGECGEVDETTSIVAKEKQGDQVNASVAKARGDMVAGQQKHGEQVNQAQADNQRKVDEEIKQKAGEQADARSDLQRDVGAQRDKWTGEQRDLSDKAQADADREGQNADSEITKQQQDANAEAAGHYKEADQKITTERQNAEQKAADKKKDGEKESSGVLSKIGSAVTSFFDGLKKAISDVFDAARKAVKGFIEAAQKLAAQAIDKARGLIVSAIHKLGDALIAIGDTLLAGFPGLRDKFRGAIKNLVQAAETAVNKIADALKKGVQMLLDILGKVLDAYLCLLRAAYMAAISYVQSVVKGAIDFAKSVVQGFAAFAALIKDIAAGPGAWLSKLGSAVVSGIKNCLWSAFKRAVKEWFNSKLEEVLGLGLLIVRILCQGGISFAQIGKMAWEGLKSAIPGILIQILIEKLVSMIVPAAGAILTIIEGLRAAWGTISRILRAFELFFKFLQAVKTGNAAGPFAEAVAAAAIVVIDFVANWLIGRLKRPAGAISGRLKGMADAFKRVLGGAARVAGRVVRAVGRAARAVGRGVVRAVKAVGRGLRAVGRTVARGVKAAGRWFAKTKVGQVLIKGARRFGHWAANTRVGKAITKLGRGIRRKYQQGRDWLKRKRDERREKRRENAGERLRRATKRAWALFQRLASIGTPEAAIKVPLGGLRAWYRLGQLQIRHDSDELHVYVHAQVNPEEDSPKAFEARGEPLRLLVHEVAAEMQQRRDVQRQATAQEGFAGTAEEPVYVQPGAGVLASGQAVRTRATAGVGTTRTQTSTIETEQLLGTQVKERGGQVGIETRTGTYPQVAQELETTMRATGLRDDALAREFRSYVRTHEPSWELRPHVDQLNRLQSLMLGIEARRSVGGGTAFAPMAIDLIARGGGHRTFGEMFAALEGRAPGGGGFFPMSMRGAERAAEDLRAQGLMGVTRLPAKRRRAASELARRETRLAEAWVRRLMGVERPVFPSREAAKRHIMSALLRFYGLGQ